MDPMDLFATDTMAELSARQGRTAEAIAIFSRLLEKSPGDQRAPRWAERLAALKNNVAPAVAVAPAPPPRAAAPARVGEPAPAPAESQVLTLPLVVNQTVRSGQIVYAHATDLIVLAPVNPGAQLMADGNIHVYAPLRGRAVAGARGARQARIFCQRLEAELVGVDSAYLTSEGLPPERFGKPAQVVLEGDRCVIMPL
jgi:septum site-determining protein MinC